LEAIIDNIIVDVLALICYYKYFSLFGRSMSLLYEIYIMFPSSMVFNLLTKEKFFLKFLYQYKRDKEEGEKEIN